MTFLLLVLAASPWQSLMPPEFPAFVPKKTNHYHLAFTWDTVPGSDSYAVYQAGGFTADFTNAFFVKSNWCVVSNLNSQAQYSFSVCAASNGIQGDFSPRLTVPWDKTNFVHLYSGAFLIAVETNPPPPDFYRASNTVPQHSSNLLKWVSLPTTNRTASPMLRLAVTNNVDGFYKPD